jgi:dihydropteroate synthase
MGALNITPDSFSDGGLFFDEAKAYDQAHLMIRSGATIIDVGGESTRPGAKVVNEKNEWERIKKIIIKLKKNFPKILLSLDTRKSYVMKKGIECEVNIINDVSGLNFDKKSFDVINSKSIPFILHHMQGTPDTMQKNPKYDDALLDIYDFFEEKINFCIKKNFKKEFIVIDPGIGFGKNLEHNLRIMSKISTFHSLGCPILIGTSRKRFIEHIVTKFDTPDRTGGTLASVLCGLLQGVQLFRVHNVKEINQGILVFNKILNTN